MSYSPSFFAPQAKGTASALVTDYTNASAITAIPQAMAVSVVDSTSLLNPLDVSDDVSAKGMVGYANVRIETSGTGPVISTGRLENYTTSYAIGTALYVGVDGNPTDIVPSEGVNGFSAGYYVIFIGIVVKNEDNPSSKDIQLMTQVVGTL